MHNDAVITNLTGGKCSNIRVLLPSDAVGESKNPRAVTGKAEQKIDKSH